MCPEASNPIIVPAVKRLNNYHKTRKIDALGPYKESIQFHPSGAPVPLSMYNIEEDEIISKDLVYIGL
jgi:hypothetical protein